MKTVGGVYLNLIESEYKFCYQGLEFYFSSKLYLDKFANNFQTFINSETLKLKGRYQISLNCDIYLMIAFYKKIEKRGFLIKDIQTGREISKNVMFVNAIIN